MSDIRLSMSLADASEVLAKILSGASIDSALAASSLPEERKRIVQSMVYYVLRHLKKFEFFLSRIVSKPPQPEIRSLLLLSVSQLDEGRREPFTICNEAVKASQKLSKNPKIRGFVNAILRNFCRKKEALDEEARKKKELSLNAPDWWIRRVKDAAKEKAEGIFEIQGLHPPLSLRVNSRKTSQKDYLRTLEENSIKAAPLGDTGVVLDQPMPVDQIPGFSEGAVSVQDYGSQLAAKILGAEPGMRVLDACAAPGGKTGHILELAECDLTALEIDPKRKDKICENLDRLGLQCEVKAEDASAVKKWWDARQFDRILLDAPCTASGIVRRQPDIPWNRKPEDIRQLAKTQKKLLNELWPTLKTGGRLLYAVCSIFPEEGEEQIRKFLEAHKSARLIPIEGGKPGWLRLYPTDTRGASEEKPEVHDGFFYALLEKEE